MRYWSLLSVATLLSFSCCTTYNMTDLDEKYYSSFVIVNSTSEIIPFLVLRMHDERSNIRLDSLFAGPLAPFDSVTIRYNFEFVPSDRMYTNKLYVWKNIDDKPLISKGFDGTSTIGRWHYTIKSDTIIPKPLRK